MRDLIDLVEGRVHRLQNAWTPWGDFSTTVYESPSVSQMAALVPKAPEGLMRGAVDAAGTVYIWPARDATHPSVLGSMQIDELASFFLVAPGATAPDVWGRRDVVAENRGIRLVMRSNEYERVRDLPAMRHLFPEPTHQKN